MGEKTENHSPQQKSFITLKLFRTLLLTLIVWECIGLVHLMAGYFDTLKFRPDHQLAVTDFAYYALAYGSWALITLVLFAILKWLAQSKGILNHILVFGLGMGFWLPIYFVFDALISAWLFARPFTGVKDVLSNTPNGLFFLYGTLYALTFGIGTSIIYYRRSQQAQMDALALLAQNSQAKLTMAGQQLQLLQSQLGPHFMFNCLGSISALARQADKESLISAVSKVGNLLRFTIDSASQKYVLLSEELLFIQDYVDLQKLRFDQRFSFVLTQEHHQDIFIPPFLIHPLIENAFVHAVAYTNQPVKIEVHIQAQNDDLHVVVRNDYVESDSRNTGLGSALKNLNERLSMMFDANFDLTYSREGEQYESKLTIPQVRNL